MPKNSKIKNQNYIENFKSKFTNLNRKTILIILVLALLLLAYYKKGWFVAALVNGQPITTLELNQKLNEAYKEQILNQMIEEKILLQEASSKGITVTESQIEDEFKKLEQQYGGSDSLTALLTQQGMSKNDLLKQIKIRLIIEALYKNEASPSAEEIEKFMKENTDLPEATEPAKFRTLAEEQLKQDKLNQVFSEKFQALKQSAKIQIF